MRDFYDEVRGLYLIGMSGKILSIESVLSLYPSLDLGNP